MIDRITIGEPRADLTMTVTGMAELSFTVSRHSGYLVDTIKVSGPNGGNEPASASMLWPKPDQLPGTIRTLTQIAYGNWSARMGEAGQRGES